MRKSGATLTFKCRLTWVAFRLCNKRAIFVCKGYLNKILCHKLGDSEVKSGVLEVSSLKSQYWCGHLPQKALQEDHALPLPGSGAQRFLGMGQSTSNFCLCLHMTAFCVSVSIAPFFMRTSVKSDLGPTLSLKKKKRQGVG